MDLCLKLICPDSRFARLVGLPASGSLPAHTHFRWTDVLNGREWATVVWFGIFVAWAVSRNDMRGNIGTLVRVALSRQISLWSALMLLYLAGVVFLASKLGLWEARLLGATLAWVLVSALLGFFRVLRVPDNPHYFRTAVRSSLRVAVIVDVYVNLFVLSFVVELFLIPFLGLMGGLVAVSEVSPELEGKEYDQTRSCLKGFVSFLGLAFVTYATIHAISEISGRNGLSHLGKSLILPLWLNLALMPFTYLLAVYLVYETAFVKLGFPGNATSASKRRAKLALLLSAGLRPYVLGDFALSWAFKLNEASTLTEARRMVEALRAERARALAAAESATPSTDAGS
jgi:hypothetical protein